MIVDTMTLEEIHKELHEDFRNTRAQLNNRVEKFKGVVLKSSRFPVRRHYECKSLQKKNRFYVQLTALKRGEFKDPLFDYYCIFDRPEGLYLAYLELKQNLTLVYPPHFFARYRERIIQDDSISNLDLIHLFASRIWAVNFGHIPPEHQEITKTWAETIQDENIDLMGMCPDGVIFGERHQDIFLLKTIVPESYLFEDQLDTYDRVVDHYHDFLYTVYPEKIADYIIDSELDYFRPLPEAGEEELQKLKEKFQGDRADS